MGFIGETSRGLKVKVNPFLGSKEVLFSCQGQRLSSRFLGGGKVCGSLRPV